MTEIPHPDLDSALAELSNNDCYKVVIDHIRHEREECFADLAKAKDPNEIMKITGGVVKLDEILRSFGVG